LAKSAELPSRRIILRCGPAQPHIMQVRGSMAGHPQWFDRRRGRRGAGAAGGDPATLNPARCPATSPAAHARPNGSGGHPRARWCSWPGARSRCGAPAGPGSTVGRRPGCAGEHRVGDRRWPPASVSIRARKATA
jgi:hypothetical protein